MSKIINSIIWMDVFEFFENNKVFFGFFYQKHINIIYIFVVFIPVSRTEKKKNFVSSLSQEIS